MKTIYTYKTKKGNNTEVFDTKGYITLTRDTMHIYEHQFSTSVIKIKEFQLIEQLEKHGIEYTVTIIHKDIEKADLENCKNYTSDEISNIIYKDLDKIAEIIGAVVHLKCSSLFSLVKRIQVDGKFQYFTDVTGDWWDYAESAILDERDTLNSHFKGTYYTPDSEAGYRGLF